MVIRERDTSDSSLPCVCEKEEFIQEVDENISDLHKIVEGGLLTINRYPAFEVDCMF